MELDARVAGEQVILKPRSPITSGEGQRLKETIDDYIRQGYRRFIVDFDGVPYIDSAGCGELISMYTGLSREGASLELLNLRPAIRRLFGDQPRLFSNQPEEERSAVNSTLKSLLFWMVLVVVGVLIWNFSTGWNFSTESRSEAPAVARSSTPATPALSDDRLCELWVGHRLRELTDTWQRRHALVVRCKSGENAQTGEITLTVSLAAGQQPVSRSQAAEAQSALNAALKAAVADQPWLLNYPKQVVQFVE